MLSSLRNVATRNAIAHRLARMIPATGTRQFHLTTKFSEEEKAAVAAEEEEGDFDIIATLSNPFYGVPIGGLAAATAVATDFYIINEETQLLGLWCLFVGTIYHNFGADVGAYFDSVGDAVLKEQNAQEEAIIESMRVTADAHRHRLDILDDLSMIRDAQNEILETIVSTKSNQLKHELRDKMVVRLDALKQLEQSVTAGVQSTMVDAATNKVLANVGSMKKKALDSAFAAIANPDAAGSDPVADEYNAVIKEFAAKAAKAKDTPIELSAAEQAEVEDELRAMVRKEGLTDDEAAALGWVIKAPTSVSPAI